MKKTLLLALVGVTTGCGDGLVVTDVPVTCYYEGGLPIIFEPTDGAFLNAVTVLMDSRALRDGWIVWTPQGLEATMLDGDEVVKFRVAGVVPNLQAEGTEFGGLFLSLGFGVGFDLVVPAFLDLDDVGGHATTRSPFLVRRIASRLMKLAVRPIDIVVKKWAMIDAADA